MDATQSDTDAGDSRTEENGLEVADEMSEVYFRPSQTTEADESSKLLLQEEEEEKEVSEVLIPDEEYTFVDAAAPSHNPPQPQVADSVHQNHHRGLTHSPVPLDHSQGKNDQGLLANESSYDGDFDALNLPLVAAEDDEEEEGEAAAAMRRARKESRKNKKAQRRLAEDAGLAHSEEDAPRSSRAAALVAKIKLKTKGSSTSVATAPEKEREKVPDRDLIQPSAAAEKTTVGSDEEAADPTAQWVHCDRCTKWRKLPAHIDPDALPESWDCGMISWPTANIVCVAEKESEPRVTDESESVEPRRRIKGRSRLEEEEPAPLDKKRSRQAPAPVPPQNVVVENITWVECQTCNKWRKVPGSIDADSLPEVWTCSLNYWAPLYAHCSAREEEDKVLEPPMVSAAVVAPGIGASSRRGRPQQSGDQPPKKVTQWVQCDRKSCGKWRKVPAHVDSAALSDNHWYCEHNHWDVPERRSCEAAEDSDESEAGAGQTDTRTQLILANSKGPSQLSYRRIIFGPDGRIKPQYAEKSRLGYGLFSYTELMRGEGGEEGQPAAPVKKVAYWASDCYDQAGALFSTACKRRRVGTSSGSLLKKHDPERLSGQSRSGQLLSAVRRLAGWDMPAPRGHLLAGKQARAAHRLTMLERLQREFSVIRSVLMSFPQSCSVPVPVDRLEEALGRSRFGSFADEACREALLAPDVLRDSLRRLEIAGEAEVTENSAGDLAVRIENRREESSVELYPLKLRKFMQRL
jgi:hypothetical protein